MKLALIGQGNLPLMQWILDGTNDDAIINMSALARRLGCSRSSLLDRIQTHGFDSTIRYYLNEQRQRKH
jgi:AraC-like DNA-binding protein